MTDDCNTNASDINHSEHADTDNSPPLAAPDLRWRHGADESFIKSLVAGNSIAHAAKLAGISERTATRRMLDPEIRQQVSDLRSRLTDIAVDQLARSSGPATQTLHALLEASSDNVKLSAARTILEKMVSTRNSNELEARLHEVQIALSDKPDPKLATSYWPPSLDQGPPCVDGLEPQDGYRLIAIWLSYQIYKGGLSEEQLQNVKSEIARHNDAACNFDSPESSHHAPRDEPHTND